MSEVAIRDLDELLLPVNSELGDRIVIAWLKQHIAWAQDASDNAIHEEDKDDAELDLIAMRRVLNYAGGEFDD